MKDDWTARRARNGARRSVLVSKDWRGRIAVSHGASRTFRYDSDVHRASTHRSFIVQEAAYDILYIIAAETGGP